MRGIGKPVERHPLILGLILALNCATAVVAGPLSVHETFSTSGTVGTTGIMGTPVVTFQGVDSGAMITGVPFSLGQFVVAFPSGGASTSYDGTPFEIAYRTETVEGGMPTPNQTPVVLHGWLYGKVGGDGLPRLIATFDQGIQPADPKHYHPYPAPPFQIGSFSNTLYINNYKYNIGVGRWPDGGPGLDRRGAGSRAVLSGHFRRGRRRAGHSPYQHLALRESAAS